MAKSVSSHFSQPDGRKRGLLVAFMGLPGSGKSTTAQEVSKLIPGSALFQEPADTEWPPAVQRRHEFGNFGALCWFRAMRVPSLFMGDQVRRNGGVAIVDSYYDKLIAGYISHPDMRWLIPTSDEYFQVLKQLANLDSDLLPNVDCLIFLRVTVDVWRHFLSTRERPMDSEEAFLQSFPTQEPFLTASQVYAERTKTPLLIVDQKLSAPGDTAKEVVERLVGAGLLGS